MVFYDYKGNDLTKKLITGKMSYEDWEKLVTRQIQRSKRKIGTRSIKCRNLFLMG